MGLHHARAVEATYHLALGVEHRPGATAARDGFVVLVMRAAESEVVHRALAGGHHTQRAQQRVGDAGGGLHIARHYRSRWARVQHRAFRDDHLERLQAARIERDVVVHQRAEHVEHCSHTHGGGGVEVVGLLRAGAGEVDLGRALGRVHTDRHLDLRTVVQRQGELAILQQRDGAAHRLLSVVLHMAHVGAYDIQAKLAHHLAQLLHALLVGGDLGLQVGQVLLRVAAGVFAAFQQRDHLGLAQAALVYQLEVVDLHTLFLDAGGERRHRAWRGAANVGLVAAAAHVEQGLFALGQVDRRDNGHVGQVGAAVVRVVQRKHVAGLHTARVLADHGLDTFAHAAQVHRHVGCVGDEVALGVEQCAAEVQPLLDVDRVGGVLQLQTHLLGDVHEQVVEHLQQHRVGRGACGIGDVAGAAALQHQVVHGGECGFPAGLDDGGGIFLGNDGRAGDHITRAQVFTHHQRGVVPCAAGVHLHRFTARHLAHRVGFVLRLGGGITGHHSFD